MFSFDEPEDAPEPTHRVLEHGPRLDLTPRCGCGGALEVQAQADGLLMWDVESDQIDLNKPSFFTGVLRHTRVICQACGRRAEVTLSIHPWSDGVTVDDEDEAWSGRP